MGIRMLQKELLQNGLLKVVGNQEDMKTLQSWVDGDEIPESLNKEFLRELDEEGWRVVDVFDDSAYFEKPAGN